MTHTIDLRSSSISSAKAAVLRLEARQHSSCLRFLLPVYDAGKSCLYPLSLPITAPTMLGYGWQRPLTWGLSAHI